MVVLVAAFPWLVFAVVVGLLVLTKSMSSTRAVFLLLATLFGAAVLKLAALVAGEWMAREAQQPGDAQAGMALAACACGIDAPLLLALAVWLVWGPLATRHREVRLQRELDLVKRTGKDCRPR